MLTRILVMRVAHSGFPSQLRRGQCRLHYGTFLHRSLPSQLKFQVEETYFSVACFFILSLLDASKAITSQASIRSCLDIAMPAHPSCPSSCSTSDPRGVGVQASPISADEAAEIIKTTAHSYLKWVPGGKRFVSDAFQDWEVARKRDHEKAEHFIIETYVRFELLASQNLGLQFVPKAQEMFQQFVHNIASLPK